MNRSLSLLRAPRSALVAASLAPFVALADVASASYLPGWAQSVANSFCTSARAGMDPRRSMRRAIDQHMPSLRSPAVADLAATSRTLAFAVMERCPELLDALQSAETPRTAPAGTGSSGACSSFILVGGRKQCI